MLLVTHALFFVSGAASLVHQIAWARSLSVVFGGSHLAVTTVLTVFMGGLSLGGALLGRRADAAARPLRLYGRLELAAGVLALSFLALARAYPTLYPPLARVVPESRVWVTAVRALLSVAAMLPAASMMGGTLPVLARLVTPARDGAAGRLGLLYAVNTFGAMAGALGCGFVLLPALGVTATLALAVALNVCCGVAALILPDGGLTAPAAADRPPDPADAGATADSRRRLLLAASAAGGFCALGYEVLWTRTIALAVGTSVYAFTIVLAVLLGGMALGAAGLGALRGVLRTDGDAAATGLGAVEVAAGVAALAGTALLRDLPAQAVALQGALLGGGSSAFAARQGATLALAALHVLGPALLLGAAFPLAASAVAATRMVARAAGDAFSWNTAGCILGACVTGFVLVPILGGERSLRLLSGLNIAIGVVVLARRARPAARRAAAVAAALLAVVPAVAPGWGSWDPRTFALRESAPAPAWGGTPAAGGAPPEVVFAFEGVNENVSVVRSRADLTFVVNGRAEASTVPADVQLQLVLGHLPMLLHDAPRSVFVLGTGSGMSLGAISVHAGVERLVLAELEPGVLPAARHFSRYNHGVLDDPRLRIVLEDGRNHLAVTRDAFDVVDADPIHPWSGGAGYLYTREYFETVRARLRPGGIACQWLPLYELSPRDVKTVVRTFAETFPHVLVWGTHWDVVLVGRQEPFVLDEAELDRRIALPGVAEDLAAAGIRSAEDLLAYFLFGTGGARAYANGAPLNTDDGLALEFSAPRAMGVRGLLASNVAELAGHRESVVPYLRAPADPGERAAQQARWRANDRAARRYDVAHVLQLRGTPGHPAYRDAMASLAAEFSAHAPSRFLRELESPPAAAVR